MMIRSVRLKTEAFGSRRNRFVRSRQSVSATCTSVPLACSARTNLEYLATHPSFAGRSHAQILAVDGELTPDVGEYRDAAIDLMHMLAVPNELKVCRRRSHALNATPLPSKAFS
jgi:hypothetical protein